MGVRVKRGRIERVVVRDESRGCSELEIQFSDGFDNLLLVSIGPFSTKINRSDAQQLINLMQEMLDETEKDER